MFKCQIIVNPGDPKEDVLAATMDMTLTLTVLALFLTDLWNPPIKGVVFGIGKNKNVSNALTIGCSIAKEFVSLSQIIAKLLISLEIADLAIKDTE